MGGAGAQFSFVDLFAGIGGLRLGLEAAGGQCVYSVEIDRFARQTYAANFDEPDAWDVREVSWLPPHALLAAGFPCQPFSVAGVAKNSSLGRPHGFLDEARGTLFFEIARLASLGPTPVLLLENVKNLISHDSGRTFETIHGTLEELGYALSYQIRTASPWVPQRRPRVFLVGLHRSIWQSPEFAFPPPPLGGPTIGSILEPSVASKYTKSEKVWAYLQAYAQKHHAAGNGFGYRVLSKGEIAGTLSARYYKDGSEILIAQKEDEAPRMLTPREAARLMGFPDSFVIPVSDTQAYKQLGNSVVVPLVTYLASALVQQGLLAEAERHVVTDRASEDNRRVAGLLPQRTPV